MKLKTALFTSAALLMTGFMAVSRYNGAQLANMASMAAHEDADPLMDTAKEFDEAGGDTEEKAQKIANAISDIEGIGKVSVVITGNSAIVGIEVEGELTDAKLIDLKKKAENKAKDAEDSIDHVAVTAGPELIKRIERIADFSGMPENNPENTSGLTPHQEEVVNSLTPLL